MKMHNIDFCKSGKFFNFSNKIFEIDLSTGIYNGNIININVEFNKNCDHAGFHFKIAFFSIFFSVEIYDSRHWDFDKNDYIRY